jgi:hypothetical protein
MNGGRWHPPRKLLFSKILQQTHPRRRKTMAVSRKTLKRIWVVLLLPVAVMIVSHPADAGVKKIWPDKLVPYNNVQESVQFPFKASSYTSDPVAFYADLKLPVGVEIKKLVYFHYGAGTAGTTVALHRQKMGNDTSPILMIGLTIDNSNKIIKVTNIPPDPVADLVVRKGYRYFLSIISLNRDSQIYGIRVSYR